MNIEGHFGDIFESSGNMLGFIFDNLGSNVGNVLGVCWVHFVDIL